MREEKKEGLAQRIKRVLQSVFSKKKKVVGGEIIEEVEEREAGVAPCEEVEDREAGVAPCEEVEVLSEKKVEKPADEALERESSLVEIMEPGVVELKEEEHRIKELEEKLRASRLRIERRLGKKERELGKREKNIEKEEAKLVSRAMQMKKKEEIHEEIKRVLTVLNKLIEELPDDTRAEFLKSEDHMVYTKILKIYGVE